MKIQVLMENITTNPDFEAEHGLSLYIETDRHKILFDSGQSAATIRNASAMGIDLSTVDLMILSHGHYDHSGGLQAFLAVNHTAPIYLSRYAFEPHLSAHDKNIGIDPTLSSCDRLIYVEDELAIDEELTLFSCNDYPTIRPTDNYKLYTIRDGVKIPEDFRHEQYLLLREGNKTVLITGCSHKGIVNLAHWFAPDILVGGFHFKALDPQSADRAVLDDACEHLLSHPTTYYTGHCTGVKQFQYLKTKMHHRVHYLSTGQVLSIE